MKLRIKGNSIRFRLTKSEVDYFAQTFLIEEQTNFVNNTFTYSIKAYDQDTLSAAFESNKITVFLPKGIAKEWVSTQIVGCRGEMEIGNGKKLYLLIEKDFKCLDETVEDQSDNFENPLTSKLK